MASSPQAGEAGSPSSEVTLLLQRLSSTGPASSQDANRLLHLVYDELRRLAGSLFAGERANHTLQPTALVHEAWVRLADQESVEWKGKAHFFAIAAQAMRRFLVDHARARGSEKRGQGWARVELDPELRTETPLENTLNIDQALQRMAQVRPDCARLVELRFFAGLSMPQTAELLDKPLRSLERDWRFARAWLMKAIEEDS